MIVFSILNSNYSLVILSVRYKMKPASKDLKISKFFIKILSLSYIKTDSSFILLKFWITMHKNFIHGLFEISLYKIFETSFLSRLLGEPINFNVRIIT